MKVFFVYWLNQWWKFLGYERLLSIRLDSNKIKKIQNKRVDF